MGRGHILHIDLFGTFRVVYKDAPVTDLDSPRLQELLAWLLLNRDSPQPRQYIAFQFWPDSSEKQALTNLRQVLHYLRKALPEADRYIKVDYKTLQWNREASWILDVEEFEHHLEAADEAHISDNITAFEKELIEAETLYKGPLLENCYRKWIDPERERLQTEYIGVLERLVELLEEKRDYPSAISYAQKLLQIKPFQEPAYRTLMHLHALNNDRANIQKTWQSCVSRFEEELDLEPSEETRKLYKRLISNHFRGSDPEIEDDDKKTSKDWPLVGRRNEWNRLLASWKDTLDGKKKFVSISGVPGIGKSRFGLELLEYVKKQGYPVAYARSYETAGTLSYGPVTDWLREDSIRKQLDNLESIWLKELARLLPELLVEYPDLPQPGPLNEKWQRRQFFTALSNVFQIIDTPVLLFLDDLQWCDRETLTWLDYLFHAPKTSDLLVAGTLRPVEGALNQPLQHLLADLRRDQCLTEIELGPLDQSDSYELANQVADEAADIDPDHLYRETEGNPLFVVETIRQGKFPKEKSGFEGWKTVQDKKSKTVSGSALPPRVNEVISARFEQLTEKARELMWLAATIGREFTLEILEYASDQNETVIIDSLEELLEHHIIRGSHTEAYDFSHDKLREVAYRKMSNARRLMLHRKIADALETIHSGNLKTLSSRLAFHFDRANQIKRAIEYYKAASEYAREIYANEESVNLLKRALALVDRLPEDENRDQMELDLQAGLGLTLAQIKGYAGDGVMEACNRVFEICKQLNEPPPVPVKRIFAIANLCIARLEKAYNLGLKLFDQARANDDNIELVEACYVLGSALVRQAKYTESKKYYEKGLEWYNPKNQKSHILRFGQDPSVICLVRLAMIEWLLGDLDKSESLRIEAQNRAEVIGHPFTLAYIRTHIAWLYNLQNEADATQTMAERVLSTSYDHGFPYWISVCEVLFGWSLFEKGRKEKGIKRMRKGVQTYDASQIRIDRPYFSSLLAEALGECGELEEAKKIVNEAVKQIDDTSDRWMEPEVYRIRAKIYRKLYSPETAQSQNSLRKAVKVAQSQKVPIFEQRALASLENLT